MRPTFFHLTSDAEYVLYCKQSHGRSPCLQASIPKWRALETDEKHPFVKTISCWSSASAFDKRAAGAA